MTTERCTVRGTMAIEFTHFWHCSSGQSGEGDVDLVPRTEDCGLPFVPGRTTRGRLKRSGWEIGVPDNILKRLFGIGSRKFDQAGTFRPGDGRLTGEFAEYCRKFFLATGQQAPEIAGLFHAVSSTAMKGGVAEKNSLRRILYAIPCEVAVEFEIEAGPDEIEGLKSDLEKCASALRAVGKGKRDGFGWCKVVALQFVDVAKGTSESSAAMQVEITLEDDIVLSATAATVGGHRTLDYIPGSNLLGAVARDLFFGKSEADVAGKLAENGIVFSNAYPVAEDGRPTSPVPFSWHFQKSATPIANNRLLASAIQNLSRTGYTGGQPVQLREGYFVETEGRLISPQRAFSLRTSVSDVPDDFEVAAQGELFGYESLKAGRTFRTTVSGDPELLKITFRRLNGQTIRLGRSKFSEYGRAVCKVTPLETEPPHSVPVAPSTTLTIFARSDLALLDKHGIPTLRPDAGNLGLSAEWTLVEERSYLRFRRYSPWNGKRGGPDIERQVISKGSVMVFSRQAPAPGDELIPLRIGMWQAEGFGEILVNPSFLESASPAFADEPASELPEAPARPVGDDFSDFVSERLVEQRLDVIAAQLAREWIEEWAKCSPVSASQWGRVCEEARHAESVQSLKGRLGGGNRDAGNVETIFGHGASGEKWRGNKEDDQRPSLAKAVLASLADQEGNAERVLKSNHATDGLKDRLLLAALTHAGGQMAANTRRAKEGRR